MDKQREFAFGEPIPVNVVKSTLKVYNAMREAIADPYRTGWLSNRDLQRLTNQSSAGRMLRRLRQHNPGLLEERRLPNAIADGRHKEFKLPPGTVAIERKAPRATSASDLTDEAKAERL